MSAIKCHGGKAYLAPKIRKLMPPHKRYVEPYFGSGAVLFSGDGEGVAEFANDANFMLMNFWRVLQKRWSFKQFARQMSLTPLSESVFKHNEATPCKRLVQFRDAVCCPKCAVRFFVRNRMSRQALGKDYVTPTSRLRRGMNEQVSAWLSAVDGLPEFAERLRRVEVWNRDAIDVIRKLDSPKTHFYCDPPYLHETRASKSEYGEFEMSEEDHQQLLQALAGIEGTFQLSGYDSDLYHDFAQAQGWSCDGFDLPNNASSAKSKQRKTECLWMNYTPGAA